MRLQKFGLLSLIVGFVLLVHAAAAGQTAGHPRGWPQQLHVATASPGGTYAVYGASLAELLQQRFSIDALTVATGGPVHNIALVNAGETEIGFVTIGFAAEAWAGKNPLAPGLFMGDARIAFPLYKTPLHVMTLPDSGIERIEDLQGRRVGVGPLGGTAASYFPRLLPMIGVQIKPRLGDYDKLTDTLRTGEIAAFALAAGAPTPVAATLAEQQPVRMLSFSPDQIARFSAADPTFVPDVIAAGTYRGQERDLQVPAIWNFAIVHKDLPASLVHALMRAAFDEGWLASVHPASAKVQPADMANNAFVWLHPGAVRYYRERGIAVAPRLVPHDTTTPDRSFGGLGPVP